MPEYIDSSAVLKKITYQQLQALAASELEKTLEGYAHGFDFEPVAYVSLEDKQAGKRLDALICDSQLDSGVFIDVTVHRNDALSFSSVLPLMYSNDAGFHFVFGDDGNVEEPLSAGSFWFYMYLSATCCEVEGL